MNFDAIQTALKTLVLALLGWTAPTDPVVWENEPRPRDNGRLALLSWVSIPAVGVDEIRWDDSGAAAPTAELIPVVVGDRVLTLQVAVETLTQLPTGNATAAVEALRTRLRRPAAKAALRDANLGLIDAKAIVLGDRKVDQRWVSRAVLEVRLNAVSVDRDTDGATSSIASAALSSNTLTGVDGVDLPDAEQVGEVIP